ncbi:hypothetical protein L7F22_033506 [Adiantum nelumboides]|nr:hypothetical protein [Adiantum nelumboides]
MAVSFPTFYGHHDENARDFMDSLEMAHLMAGRDQEEVKLRAFPLVLKGEARVWYDALVPPSEATWPALYGAFLNKYGQGDTPKNLWKQLLQHCQGSLGDYNTYESKFTNLWERWAASLQGQGGAPNFLKRDKFVEGMFPTVKENVEAKFPQTFEEAQEIATVKFKKLLYQERKSNCVKEREEVNVPQHTNNAQPRVASISADSHQEDLLHKLTQQLETLTLNLVQAPTRGQKPRDDARPLRRSTQELRCWNCNEIGHGKHNQVADALSRWPKVNAVSIATHNDLSLMIDEYAIDPNFKDVISAIALGKKEEPFTLQDGYLLHGNRLCITRSLCEKVMFESHAPPYAGHRGIQTTMKAIETYFYWPTMKGDIQDYVSKCVVCQKTKYDRGKHPGFLQPLPILDSPWKSISMDFIFGLPKSIHGNTGIWTIIDRFSKQAHFIPVKKTIKAHQMATLFISQVFKYHGLQTSIVLDRDPRMTSNFWKRLFENLGIRLNFSSAYHPQTDG